MRYQKGDKVIPIKKTTGCPIEESNMWHQANKRNQIYLYVIKDDGKRYSLSHNPRDIGGDWFRHDDLLPYVVSDEELFEQFVRGQINEQQYKAQKERR